MSAWSRHACSTTRGATCSTPSGTFSIPDGLNRGRGRLEEDRGQYDTCRTALFPSGAAALYTRRMLDDIGLFDETFFLYGDDAELGLRGRVAGWGCALAPRAIAYHHYSRSAGAYSTPEGVLRRAQPRPRPVPDLFPVVAHRGEPRLHGACVSACRPGARSPAGGRPAVWPRARPSVHLAAIALRAYASALRALPACSVSAGGRGAGAGSHTSEFRRLLDEFRLRAREAALKD